MSTHREALEQILRVMGPEVPSCSDCEAEWSEALRIARDALASPAVPDGAVSLLTDWQARMGEADRQLGALSDVVGVSPESPLPASILAVMGAYTTATAERCGISALWLEGWWLEHAFGAKPMRAGPVGEPLRTIKTIEELAALICDDAEGAQG